MSLLVGALILGAGGYFGYKRYFAKSPEQTATPADASQPQGQDRKGPSVSSGRQQPGAGAVPSPSQIVSGAPGGPKQQPGAKTASSGKDAAAASQKDAAGMPFFAEPVGSIQPPQRTQPETAATPPAVASPTVTEPPPTDRPIYSTPVGAIPPPRSEAPIAPAAPSAPATASTPTTTRYTGPTSGLLIWSGPLRRDGTVVIEGDRASEGTLQGALPGVPVMIESDSKDVGFAEMPGPSNGWKRLSFRGRRNQNVVVTLRWKVLQ